MFKQPEEKPRVPGDDFSRLVKWHHEDAKKENPAALYEDSLRTIAKRFPQKYDEHCRRVGSDGGL